MIRRVVWMFVAFAAATILLYLSRFWVFELWTRAGLFGISELRPQGGLLARWLSGTALAPFELLIWVVSFFLIMTWLERGYARFRSS